MMTIKILQAYKEGKTLVFPGEIAAKSACLYVAKQTKLAVFQNRFLSWDVFKKNCTVFPQNKEKAQTVHRILFTRAFFNESAADLKFFFNKFYPESQSMAESEVSKNIVHFAKAFEKENSGKLSIQMLEDVRLIYNSYCAFLQENGLYEEAFFKPDFSSKKDDCVLVFPSSYRDSDVSLALKAGLETIENNEELPVLNVYGNTFIEIKDVLNKVVDLLNSGASAGDIVITCTDMQNNFAHIENYAGKLGIKVEGIVAKKLYETKSGKIFSKFSELVSTNLSLDSLKSLLLDPVFPIKDRQKALKIVRLAIERKVDQGLDTFKRKFADKPDFYSYVEKLYSYASAIVKAKTCNDIRVAFNGFQDDYLLEHTCGNESGNESLRILSRCIKALDELESAVNLCNVAVSDVFSVFSDVLRQTVYVSQSSDFVKVYQYPATCGAVYEHHFVLGCDDEHTKISRSVLPFAERTDECQDISSSVLKSFCLENTYISFSEETYSSVCSQPALFLENGRINEIRRLKEDCFDMEEEMFRSLGYGGFLPLETQKKAVETAFPVLLKGFETDTLPSVELPVKLSASKISAFETCPYKWLYSSVLKIKEEDFEVVMENASEIGQLLHETFEDFFKKVIYFDRFPEQTELLNDIFKEKLKKYSHQLNSPDEIHITRIDKKYRDILKNITDKADFLDSTKLLSTEEDFKFEKEDYVITGRIDCVMQTIDGSYIVLDFKKKNFDKKSLQLVLYSKALEENDNYQKPAISGAFYSIEDKNYYIQWPNKDNSWENLLFDYQKRVDTMVNKIKDKDFSFVLGKDTCNNCSYSRICRKRYVIK